MKFFYCSEAAKVNEISQNGITAGDDRTIPIIALDERFLMYQFVVDAYAYEVLEIEEFCFFEISPKGIVGEIGNLKTNDIFAPFYKMLKQNSIDKEHLTPQVTDRYESMGFGTGVFLVENKQNFSDSYKRKILEYAKEAI